MTSEEKILQSLDKLKTFSVVPESALSAVSEEKPKQTIYNVEKEFAETGKHTQTDGLNTGNTENSELSENIESSETSKSPKNRLGKLIKGNYAVTLIDMLLPSLIVLVINYIGYQSTKKQFQLNKDEKEAIIPAIQDVLDSIELDFNNPYINLSVVLGIVYGSKIIEVVPELKRKAKVNDKEETTSQNITQRLGSVVEEITGVIHEKGNKEKFEEGYNRLCDEIRNARGRGIGDAKEYLAKFYPEKIKVLGEKYSIPNHVINELLNFKHIPKKRIKKDEPEIKL